MLIKVLLLILPGHIMALKFAYIFKCICFRLIEGGPLFLYVNIVQGFFFFLAISGLFGQPMIFEE